MKLSEIKTLLPSLETVAFSLPNGTFVPEHFHVTEVGLITKNFIDCGGTVRQETIVNFQLWNANDDDHRLKPGKLLKIIELSQKVLGIADHEIEVEYQSNTIGKYGLGFSNGTFNLLPKNTACLASGSCGTLETKSAEMAETEQCCAPGGGCC